MTDRDWIRNGMKRVKWVAMSFLDALFGPIECDDCGLWMSRNAMRWELEDGRTVCHRCCVADTSKLLEGRLARSWTFTIRRQ